MRYTSILFSTSSISNLGEFCCRLTAYVSLAFSQAKAYIYVDDDVVKNALNWLAEKQAANGSFIEAGNVVHEELQNKDGKSLALTAYVLLTFQENQVSATR